MDYIKKFFIKNTPEAALIGALLAAATGYFTAALTAQQAILASIAALVAYGFAEANKDAALGQQ